MCDLEGDIGEFVGELLGVEPGDIKGGGVHMLSRCSKVECSFLATASDAKCIKLLTFLNLGITA